VSGVESKGAALQACCVGVGWRRLPQHASALPLVLLISRTHCHKRPLCGASLPPSLFAARRLLQPSNPAPLLINALLVISQLARSSHTHYDALAGKPPCCFRCRCFCRRCFCCRCCVWGEGRGRGRGKG
jgi:hypothetical protein